MKWHCWRLFAVIDKINHVCFDKMLQDFWDIKAVLSGGLYAWSAILKDEKVLGMSLCCYSIPFCHITAVLLVVRSRSLL